MFHERLDSGPGKLAAVQTYVHDISETGTAVCLRRTALGVLVCSHLPVTDGDAVPLIEVLDASAGPMILEIRNDPGEADFDAPHEETARLLVELLTPRRDDVLVASRDWFAIERVNAAPLKTAFISGPGVKVGGGLAYVAAEGHAALIAHAHVIGPDAQAKAAELGVELIAWGGTPAHPVDGQLV